MSNNGKKLSIINWNLDSQDLKTLFAIKVDHPARLEQLILNKNQIVQLYSVAGQTVACLFEKCHNLRSLTIKDNPLRKIHPNNFKTAGKNLLYVNFQNNCISKELNFRFARNLVIVEVLIIRNHECYNLTVEKFMQIIKRKLVRLKILDIRCKGQKPEQFPAERLSRLRSFFP